MSRLRTTHSADRSGSAFDLLLPGLPAAQRAEIDTPREKLVAGSGRLSNGINRRFPVATPEPPGEIACRPSLETALIVTVRARPTSRDAIFCGRPEQWPWRPVCRI